MNDKEKINNYKITKEEFNKIKYKAMIIDVRDPTEFQILQKIPNAINIPYRTLIANPKKYIPNKKTIIITICNAGYRSTVVAEFLRKQGYLNAYVLMLGIYEYYK